MSEQYWSHTQQENQKCSPLMFIFIWVWVPPVCGYLTRPEEGAGCPGAGVIRSCELYYMNLLVAYSSPSSFNTLG